MKTTSSLMPPPFRPGYSSGPGTRFGHCPGLGRPAGPSPGVAECEKVLAEWFGRPVVLLSSGRAGLDLFLRSRGFKRHEHRVQVPRYLSRCVLNALTYSAFPVELPQPGDGLLLYHAFGFPQRGRPRSPLVIEDIAHAFFGDGNTGRREWVGEVAVFSLPKFFATGGLAGGLVCRDEETAGPIREWVRRAPPGSPEVRGWMRAVAVGAGHDLRGNEEQVFLESAYELLFKFVRPDPLDLAGFPASVAEIREVGKARLERVNVFRKILGAGAVPPGFWDRMENLIPHALPYFGPGGMEQLRAADRALGEQGVEAGIYHVDVRRDTYDPEYRPCLLLPCHQDIALEPFINLCEVVRRACQ
jgi:hypothetical protein